MNKKILYKTFWEGNTWLVHTRLRIDNHSKVSVVWHSSRKLKWKIQIHTAVSWKRHMPWCIILQRLEYKIFYFPVWLCCCVQVRDLKIRSQSIIRGTRNHLDDVYIIGCPLSICCHWNTVCILTKMFFECSGEFHDSHFECILCENPRARLQRIQ